jgi:GNAT superfamily N-acetyltransferase
MSLAPTSAWPSLACGDARGVQGPVRIGRDPGRLRPRSDVGDITARQGAPSDQPNECEGDGPWWECDGMNVTTRMATGADLPFLCDVDDHLSHQDLANVVSLGRVMVAEVDKVAVGFLRWGLFWDQVPFMNLLWVLPKWRGHRVGTMLVEAWEGSQRALGHSLVLTSTSSSERAQHLYRRLGYVDSGSLLLPDEPSELILRKPLGE